MRRPAARQDVYKLQEEVNRIYNMEIETFERNPGVQCPVCGKWYKPLVAMRGCPFLHACEPNT